MSYRITSSSKKLLKYYKDEFDTGEVSASLPNRILGAWILAGNIYWSFHESVFFWNHRRWIWHTIFSQIDRQFLFEGGDISWKEEFSWRPSELFLSFREKNVRDNCARETGQKITYSLLNLKKTGTRCFTFNSNENEWVKSGSPLNSLPHKGRIIKTLHIMNTKINCLKNFLLEHWQRKKNL